MQVLKCSQGGAAVELTGARGGRAGRRALPSADLVFGPQLSGEASLVVSPFHTEEIGAQRGDVTCPGPHSVWKGTGFCAFPGGEGATLGSGGIHSRAVQSMLVMTWVVWPQARREAGRLPAAVLG